MSTVVVAVIGTVIGAFYATQSSHFAMAQTVISAFRHGQQMPALLKPWHSATTTTIATA